MMYKHPSERDIYVYHASEPPKIINQSELADYIAEGWDDNPSPFVKYEEVGLDRQKITDGDIEEKMKAEQVLVTIAEIAKFCNDCINLDYMRRSELEEFAEKHCNTILRRSWTLKKMREKIRSKLGDNG